MVRERLLRSQRRQGEPAIVGRELSEAIQESYRSHLQELRRERSARQGTPRMSGESLRNRVVVHEMKLVYDQLTGVGDYLLDLKLPAVLNSTRRASRLTRRDLETLNEELARLVSSIFGPAFAEHAQRRIDDVIQRAYG